MKIRQHGMLSGQGGLSLRETRITTSGGNCGENLSSMYQEKEVHDTLKNHSYSIRPAFSKTMLA